MEVFLAWGVVIIFAALLIYGMGGDITEAFTPLEQFLNGIKVLAIGLAFIFGLYAFVYWGIGWILKALIVL